MMSTSTKALGIGIIGCGDFLRLQAPNLEASASSFKVTGLYDPLRERAEKYGASWTEARIHDSADALIASPDVEVVAIFVPPWLRRPLVERAARCGKHLITTKPFAPSIADCAAMNDAIAAARIKAAVIYNRTESPMVATLKQVLEKGDYGRLALFKQDWIHHYPAWNTWALDPTKNGGPFMDAMIHNLNIVRHLMARRAVRATLFSDRHAHPTLSCADTEFMKLDFEGNASAHLFITWAADLRHDAGGNFREHHDVWFAVTDQGWRISSSEENQGRALNISRLGSTDVVPFVGPLENPFDEFARLVRGTLTRPVLLSSTYEAAEDIRIICQTSKTPGRLVEL